MAKGVFGALAVGITDMIVQGRLVNIVRHRYTEDWKQLTLRGNLRI
jgi:hypothetical protein